MAHSDDYKEEEIMRRLASDDDKALAWLFNKYYGDMCKKAYRLVPDAHIVEDLVQDVFYEIWKKRKTLKIL